MTTTTIVRHLGLLAASLTFVGLPACDLVEDADAPLEAEAESDVDENEEAAAIELEQLPAASEYVFGLDEQQVMSLYDLVDRSQSPEQWLQLHVAPFQCAPYGTLCDDIGADVTEQIMAQGYAMALDGVSIDEVDAFLWTEIDAATEAAEAAEADSLQAREWKEDFFCDGGDKRLKIRSKASHVPLSAKMKGECVCAMQVNNVGLWVGKEADILTADCEINFEGGPIEYDLHKTEYQENKIVFSPESQYADTMVTVTRCEAQLDAWSCSGTVANAT